MRVLVVAKEAFVALALCEELETMGHVVIGPARSSGEALLLSDATRPHCAIVAEHLERDDVGAQLASRLRERHDMRVVSTSEKASMQEAHLTDLFHSNGRWNAKAVVRNLPPRIATKIWE